MTDLIHELFRGQAAATPQATALIDDECRITYEELDRFSDAMACSLADAGLGRGKIVPVVAQTSAELVTALLAVLKLGAAYAVLDPAWPSERLRDMARRFDGDPMAIVGSEAPAGVFQRYWKLPPNAALGGRPHAPRITALTGSDVAMVFMTSGTTGEPKAVLSPHQGTVRLLRDCPFARLGPSTVMPLTASPPWDAFALELWGCLLTGGSCALPREWPPTPRIISDMVLRSGVNTVFLTTSLFHLIIEEDLAALRGVRTVIVGGEKMSSWHAARFLSEYPKARLVNGYGPVESTIFALYHDVRTEDVTADIPLGRPVPRTQVFVMSGDRICAQEEVGEICIAGDGLAKGYLDDPELTSRKFVRRRIGGLWTRVYRTGDCGYVAEDGTIRFAGRTDRQVKVRGHRVEPTEVELAVTRIPGVRRSILIPVTEPDGRCESLALFYCREPGGPSAQALTAALRTRLPAYLVPDAVYEKEVFPLSANGKLDLGELRSIAKAKVAADARASLRAPADTPLDIVVAAFADVLGGSVANHRDTFYSQGGTSLDSIRLCARLGTLFQRAIPVSQLARTPSPAELAAWLEQPVPAPCAVQVTEGAPLTMSQASFLLANLDASSDAVNHCMLVWKLVGDVDCAALAAAVEDVHLRHAYLRARYELDNGAAAFPSGTPSEFRSTVADPADAEDWLRRELTRPFDLFRGRVWRSALVRVGNSGHWLFGVNVHHIAFDGWSEHVLAQDLGEAYAARRQNAVPVFAGSVPGITETYELLRRSTAGANLPAQRQYWAQKLADMPRLDLGQGTREFPVPVVEYPLSPDLIVRIDAEARAHASGRLAVLLGAIAMVLTAVMGQSDFGVGVPVTRRVGEQTARLVGCLIDTMCVRIGPAPWTGSREAARGVLEALAHSDLSFAEVVQACGVQGKHQRAPLYQVLAEVQDAPEPVLYLPGLAVRAYRLQTGAPPPAALSVELFVNSEPYLRVSSDPSLVDPRLTYEIAAGLLARLEGMP
jgi:amino acid adenylation domain-containing protein